MDKKRDLLALITHQEEKINMADDEGDYELVYKLEKILDQLEEEYQQLVLKDNYDE